MKLLLPLFLTFAAALIGVNAQTSPANKPAAKPPGPKWQKVLPETPPGVTMSKHTVAEFPGHNVELVVYVPDKPGHYPAILDIHGGGWEKGRVESDRPMMERLAARGFVTALVSYRLSGHSQYPAALHDCKAAVRMMRAKAAEWKIDPERIGVMGGSAGGHLSGLLAMTSGKPEFEDEGPFRNQSSAVKACIVMAATQDLVAANREKTSPNAVKFFGGECAQIPDIYTQASPITHVRAGVPPTIYIEGEKDTLKIGRAEMQEKLRALCVDTALHTLKDAPHPFWMSQPWCDEVVEIADAFFKKHLGQPNTGR